MTTPLPRLVRIACSAFLVGLLSALVPTSSGQALAQRVPATEYIPEQVTVFQGMHARVVKVSGGAVSVRFIPSGTGSGDFSKLYGVTRTLLQTPGAALGGDLKTVKAGGLVILDGYVQMNVKKYDDCPIRRSRLRENGTRRIYCDEVADWSFSYHYSKLVATGGRCGLSSKIKIDIPWEFPNASTRLGVCSFDAGKKALVYLENWAGINAVSAEVVAKKAGATSTDRVEIKRGWTVFFTPSNPAAYGGAKGVSISGRLLVDIADDGAGPKSRTVKKFRL